MKKWVLIGIVLGVVLALGAMQLTRAPDYGAKYSSEVILYSTSWCPSCKKTRAYLKQQGIPYVEFDIEKSSVAYKEHKSLGGRGVPLLLVNGILIQGYDPVALSRAYQESKSKLGS